jgi:hypothetical protein
MTSNLNLTTRSARGGLIVGCLLAATVLPVGATLSVSVASYGTTTSDYPPASVTDIAGQIVLQSATGENYCDSSSISGGAPGDLVSVSLSGRTTYRFAITDIAGITDTRSFNVEQSFSVSTRPDFKSVVLDTADFVSNAGAGFVDWSMNFVGTVGMPVNVNSYFDASSDCCYDVLSGTQDYDVTYSFDSMNTSRLQRIELPSGYSLTADSGEIVAHDGAFADRAAVVPEPQTWALLVFGLGVLGRRAARRQA